MYNQAYIKKQTWASKMREAVETKASKGKQPKDSTENNQCHKCGSVFCHGYCDQDTSNIGE